MSTLLTDTRSTATTYATTHTTTHSTHTPTTPASARPVFLHPPRPPSRNKILCDFAKSQTVNSYGSWRFTASPADYDQPSSKDIPSDGSRPASPISSSSSSERDDRLADSTSSPAYQPDVLRARVSRGSTSLGSSWGVSSIGRSINWTWNASDDTGGASDADTEPTDEDYNQQEVQVLQQEQQEQQRGEQEQEQENSSSLQPVTSDESPNTARAFGFHSLGSPLTAQTQKSNSILDFDLSPYTPYTPYTHTYTVTQNLHISPLVPRITSINTMTALESSQSPVHSRPISPLVSPNLSRAPSSAGSTTSSRFRRRSSQKRISLIAGRVSYTPPPSPPPVDTNADEGDGDGEDDHDYRRSPRLLRLNSTSSFMSLASTVATAPPTPAGAPGPGTAQASDYLGERSISEFVIQGDVGRGAYGLVKRGREVMSNGSYGPEVIIKQVIKSRILADCWKKHPTHGTIPIEIYVMLALSSASYVLPERRPWDSRRGIWRAEQQERLEREDKERADSGSSYGEFNPRPSATPTTSATPIPPVLDSGDDQDQEDETAPSPELATPEDKKPRTLEEKYLDYTTVMQPQWEWEEGKIVRAHPNICPLIDFFEDRNFYYLILPSTLPPLDSVPDADPDAGFLPPAPKDLFDLVEQHPMGLPAHLVRSYLGQIADAMAFLHMRGIVHRDIKDENVVLSANGDRCWLIDFGSAGIVRRNGWNSFSGTLDYASPEILRGEFYTGKEQDVWAFGVVAYVLLVGECPFATAADAQAGLVEGSSTWEGLEARCGRGRELEGEEEDGGGALGDAAELVRGCLKVEVAARPTAEAILGSRFLNGRGGWGMDRSTDVAAAAAAATAV